MDELIELVLLFQRTKFKSAGMMGLVVEPGSQMERLYQGIAEGHVRTDEDIEAHLPELRGARARISTLKSYLKTRLIDAVLLLDQRESNFSDRQRTFFDCSRKWASVVVLLSKNARRSAISLAEDLLRTTRRFEFTDLSIEILRMLSLHYALIEGKEQKCEVYEEELTNFEQIRMAEHKVERSYIQLVTQVVRKKLPQAEVMAKAFSFKSAVEPFVKQYDTYRIHLFGRLTEIAYYDCKGDYDMMARLSKEALHFFDAKDYMSFTAQQAFIYNQIIANMNMRRYTECAALAAENRETFKPGTFNWFKLQEAVFLTALHTAQYQAAQQKCAEVLRHSAFTASPAPIQELWQIFRAYIAYLEITGKIEPDVNLSRFRLSRFSNDIQLYAQDKSGMNIPVLVIEFLHYLANGDYGRCIDKVDALAKYRTRYLKDESVRRSWYFIQLLESTAKSSFSGADIGRRGAQIMEKIRATPLELGKQNIEIEIIPYETLWELVLANLIVSI
jgi:hypothetical protein